MTEPQENETPPPPPPEASPPPTSEDMVTKANEAADRMEAANKELASLLDKQERLKVEETLGGKTTAGKPTQSKEDKEIADARKLLKGTGYDDDLFPTKKA